MLPNKQTVSTIHVSNFDDSVKKFSQPPPLDTTSVMRYCPAMRGLDDFEFTLISQDVWNDCCLQKKNPNFYLLRRN